MSWETPDHIKEDMKAISEVMGIPLKELEDAYERILILTDTDKFCLYCNGKIVMIEDEYYCSICGARFRFEASDAVCSIGKGGLK